MITIPRIDGDFTPIYIPVSDVFHGPDSTYLKTGDRYDDWIPNDHTLIRDRYGIWHGFGITGPSSPLVHEAEWMAFHISGPEGTLAGSLGAGEWTEHPKVLYPADRPGERNELWAPFVIERDGLYYMYYGPTQMRCARSSDLFDWEPLGPVFEQEGGARDPFVFALDGLYYMVYIAWNTVFLRSSSDLEHWSQDPVEIFRMPVKGAPESPFVIQHAGAFYLFWCIHDGNNSNYDNRTFVFRSDNLTDFHDRAPVCMLRAHAPEVIRDMDGWMYITSAEWPQRGVSMARLVWE
jgi:beta-xylosidase